jgi:hypothetical protein
MRQAFMLAPATLFQADAARFLCFVRAMMLLLSGDVEGRWDVEAAAPTSGVECSSCRGDDLEGAMP